MGMGMNKQPHLGRELKRKACKNGGWIAGAIKRPGALRKALHVPVGKNIPANKLDKAVKSDSPKMAKRAQLAKTLKGFKK